LKEGKDIDIVNFIEDYYSFGQHRPKVTITENRLNIEIDVPTILTQEGDFRKVINLCEKGRYDEAIPTLKNLIQKNPTNSEYHRIMGQILFDKNEVEESMNYLISSLRWDSRNKSALTMMGNLLFRKKNDPESAMKYYNQVLKLNPNDYIVINNIAVNYLNKGDYKTAEQYFNQVLDINPEYPNSYLGLGMSKDFQEDYHTAFEYTLKAMDYDKKKEFYQNSLKQLLNITQKIVQSQDIESSYQKYIKQLEREANKEIRIEIDENISTVAKLELAENYNRPYHLIKYKESHLANEHLIFHELVHLDFIIEARKLGENQLFISSSKNEQSFRKSITDTIRKLEKNGISSKNLEGYTKSLFHGLNSLVFNTPIDLFIENYLYETYPELRPFQLLSLNNMIVQGKNSVTDKKIIEISPKDILSKTKVYNIVSALQFRDLYGIDYIADFNPSKTELKTALEFYDEYLEYKDDRKPAEEYELVQNWADDLQLSQYFELVDENGYRESKEK
jgi:tetratricopeptide (TPR) repeat protein